MNYVKRYICYIDHHNKIQSYPIDNDLDLNTRINSSEDEYFVYYDYDRGLLSVEHSGNITWDILQKIKNKFFGIESVAIEVYPPQSKVVNNVCMRHLWKLGDKDWWPDLSKEGELEFETLQQRFVNVKS